MGRGRGVSVARGGGRSVRDRVGCGFSCFLLCCGWREYIAQRGGRVEGQPPIHRRLVWYEGGGGAPPPKNVGRLIDEHVDCEKSSVFFMLTT